MSSEIVIIGAASAKGQDYIQALLDRPNDATIVAIVINQTMPKKVEEWAKQYKWKVIQSGNIQELLDSVRFDTALVALPHNQHNLVTKMLLAHRKYIIKEKPLGITLLDAQFYKSFIAEKNCTPIFTTVQRSTHPLFVLAKADLEKIGRITSFMYIYTFNLPNQTSGWRSDPVKSGGGVVLDMGYHILDVIHDFFGYPDNIQSAFGYKFPEFEKSKLEDSAQLRLTYKDFEGKIILDRHAEAKLEQFEIVGEGGKIVLSPISYTLFTGDEECKKVEMALSKIDIIQKMFDVCLRPKQPFIQQQFDKNLDTMRMIDTIYSQK